MEALERAQQRNQQRLNPDQVLKPVTVSTINDIKRVVAEFDPARNPRQVDVPLSATLEVHEDGKKNVYQVSANTRSKSKRDMLIEGLTVIKNREDIAAELEQAGEIVEINGKPMKPVVLNTNTGRSWVDPLIGQWTGGTREGIFIVWTLDDGYKYKYDVFLHKLTKVPNGDTR